MRGVWAKVLMKTIEFEQKVSFKVKNPRKTMTKEEKEEKLNFQKHENTLAWTF